MKLIFYAISHIIFIPFSTIRLKIFPKLQNKTKSQT